MAQVTQSAVVSGKGLDHSHRAFEQAQQLMPGGVSSPVRAYQAVGGAPIFIRQGKGAWVTDLDGCRYLDYVGSYGPLILGHAPPPVLAALSKVIARGTSFGMPTEAETTLAAMVTEAVPSIELVRFVSSGTEATMSAIRVARAATGRSTLIKCTGCYHGHSDALLVRAGSGATTFGVPSSSGVPEPLTSLTLLVPYNDLDAAREVFEQRQNDLACMIVEPVAGNMGCVPPKDGYLQGLRELCDRYGVLLIFDEVMTGFRVGYGGAQVLYAVSPDLTCLGKILGGGLPCAAYGGGEEFMRQVAPDGPVYQAGTLSGNPLAMAAGIVTLEALRNGEAYAQLEQVSDLLASGLREMASHAGVPVDVKRVGSMLSVFFSDAPVDRYEQAIRCDTDRFAAFFRSMRDHGVLIPPSQFESWFISIAHDTACVQRTLNAAARAFEAAKKPRPS